MAANSLLASAVQIGCYLAYRTGPDLTAEKIARSLRTNPVVVRKILRALKQEGLVTIRRGRQGGVELSRPPAQISLADIHRAVGSVGGLFSYRREGNPRCPVNNAMPLLLEPAFKAAGLAVQEALARTTIGELVGKIPAAPKDLP